jgi:uncharacterized protein YndB with AHSA1/START domain
MQFENKIQISAPITKVYALYADVPNWPSWDVEVKSASIEGPVVSGARGVIVPHGGPKSVLNFVKVQPNKSMVMTCKLPLCVMRFDYELASTGTANHERTEATHRVTFEGLLAPIFGRLIGSGMRKSLPKAMQGLKQAAEAGSGSNA